MYTISSYRGNRPTHTHTSTHTPTNKRAITIHCVAASMQCNYSYIHFLNENTICLYNIYVEQTYYELQLCFQGLSTYMYIYTLRR